MASEEHLLTANVCLQNTLAANTPLWIISLDLSKAFDKVDWNALWTALGQHGISEHLIWILQCVYFGQTGVVREHDTDSCGFNIRGGVRQGCVLSPRLFSSVLEMALSSWRAKMEAEGLSLEDGLKPLLELRFADGILVFCTTLDKACLLLDELVASLAQVGLTLNLKKTKILTTQTQPPQQLQTRGGVTLDVLDRVSTHKWLGCLLHAGGCHDADIDFHLQAALRAFNANRWILIDRHVSLATRLRYFDTIITPVPCFAAGHRTILKKDLSKIDVIFRKLLRSVVGPPAATDWSRPWHEILHDWNARVVQFVEQYSVKHWSVRCLEMHWKLAHYAANLGHDEAIWLKLSGAPSFVFASPVATFTGRGRRPWHRYGTWPQRFCNGDRPFSTGWYQPLPNSQARAARPCVQGPRPHTTRQGGAHAPCVGAGSYSDVVAA